VIPSPAVTGSALVAAVAAAAAAVALTLVAYGLALRLHARVRHPAANPVLVAIALVLGLLLAMGVDYEVYARGGRFIAALLGPAVVALGVPLYLRLDEILARRRAIGLAILAGSVVGILSGTLVAVALGASRAVALTLAPRSVTTPIAMGIADRIGGVPPLAATLVIATGVLGAVCAPWLLRLAGVRTPLAWGLALGASSHGAGTARALEEGEAQGAASGLAIALMGVATAVLVPPLVALLALLGLLP
jgi:predicted murein hydrolase (TIGR00659 family)